MTQQAVTVIGGGVAGCAAALTAARLGATVTLIEQRGSYLSPLHQTDLLAELVGRPDLGATDPTRASGLLKAELRVLVPDLLECADATNLGQETLALDRLALAQAVTERVAAEPAITLVREQARALPEGVVVVASGPTTWSPLSRALHEATNEPFRFAYAGRAPMIAAAGIDSDALFEAEPHPGADPAWYVALTEDEAECLRTRLLTGETAAPPELDPEAGLADGTQLAERMAEDPRQFRTRLLGGPRAPGAPPAGPALRLVADDRERTRLHVADLVTALSPEAQQEALRALSALSGTELVRPGLVHRFPWLPGAQVLLPTLQLRRMPRILLAGTLPGVFGASEAMATGAMAGCNAARLARGEEALIAPAESLTGALCRALVGALPGGGRLLQAGFGLLPERAGDQGRSKEARRAEQISRALAAIEAFAAEALGP